jgi:broad specificity phosphatase PhoE
MLPFPYRLIFVRHGETAWNAEGRLQGQHEVPLNARGRDQAASAGRLLRHWLGARTDELLDATGFVASPMLRTRETLRLFLGALGRADQEVSFDDRLKEMSFGDWEGLTWADLKRSDPAALRARKADKWGFRPPGGESYAMLAARVAGWLGSRSRDTLAVSHGGVARVLLHLLGGRPRAEVSDAEIFQGRLLVFENGSFSWI